MKRSNLSTRKETFSSSITGEEWGRAKRSGGRGRGRGAGAGRGKKRKTAGSDSDAGSNAGSGSDQPKKKRKSGGGGFNKSLTLSEDLAAIVGTKEAPRC
jgi:chromatin remodeling complex protein RSC6